MKPLIIKRRCLMCGKEISPPDVFAICATSSRSCICVSCVDGDTPLVVTGGRDLRRARTILKMFSAGATMTEISRKVKLSLAAVSSTIKQGPPFRFATIRGYGPYMECSRCGTPFMGNDTISTLIICHTNTENIPKDYDNPARFCRKCYNLLKSEGFPLNDLLPEIRRGDYPKRSFR